MLPSNILSDNRNFYHATTHSIIKQDFIQTGKMETKWKNAFFIDTKLQSKIEVILINRVKCSILFVRKVNGTCL